MKIDVDIMPFDEEVEWLTLEPIKLGVIDVADLPALIEEELKALIEDGEPVVGFNIGVRFPHLEDA